ncbi:hypothetical protein ACFQ0M_48095 [Kitasatospora aburaviensis]
MPQDLREGQWNLIYDGDEVRPGADMLFGTLSTGIYLLNEPAIDFADATLGDAPLPLEDGIRFGQDTTSTMTLSFELAVDTVAAAQTPAGRHTANLDAVDTLLTTWDAAAVRRRMGAVAVLRTRQGGRYRRVYGRPRHIALANSRFARQGSTSLVGEFVAADTHWYDDAEESTSPGAAPAPIRGLKAPLTSSLSQRVPAPVQQPGAMNVAGTVPTWPVITIHGPGRNPTLTFFGPERTQQGDLRERMTVGLDLTLGEGSGSPSTPSLGANRAAQRHRRHRRRPDPQQPAHVRHAPAPGLQHVRYAVADETGTSYATVAWRAAHRYP